MNEGGALCVDLGKLTDQNEKRWEKVSSLNNLAFVVFDRDQKVLAGFYVYVFDILVFAHIQIKDLNILQI